MFAVWNISKLFNIKYIICQVHSPWSPLSSLTSFCNYKLWTLVVQDNNFTKNQKLWILDTTQEEVLFRAISSSWSLDHCWCDLAGHVTCDQISLFHIAGKLYLPLSLFKVGLWALMYMASLTPLVSQLGSRSNICVSSSLMLWLGLSLLICFDTSEEEVHALSVLTVSPT